jgi:hypothetical protein
LVHQAKEEPLMSDEQARQRVAHGSVALVLGLGGLVLAVLIAVLAGLATGRDFSMPAYGVFIAFQLAAITPGLLTWTSVMGKTAVITSLISVMGSLLFLR